MSDFFNRSGGSQVLTDLEVDGTTVVVDEDNNRVGMGTDAPQVTLQVQKGTTQATIDAATTAQTTAVFSSDLAASSGNALYNRVILLAKSGGNVSLNFGDESAVDIGGLIYDNTNDSMVLRTNNATRVTVDSSGSVGIGTPTPLTPLHVAGAAPYQALQNTAVENGEGGCESRILFADHSGTALAQIEGSHSGTADDTKGKLNLFTHTGSALTAALTIDEAQLATFSGDVIVAGTTEHAASITVDGATASVALKEMANAPADTAAFGQLWVKTATPNELYFTTDAGDDIQLTSGTASAGGGGGATLDANLIFHTQVFGR